jgi:hypothetical protein
MNTIKLISEQFIKDNSPLMNNVENQFISIHILESQNIELLYAIGEETFNEIITQYSNWAAQPGSDINIYVTPQNQYIRNEFIKWILLYYTLYHSVYDLDSKLTNKGYEQQHSSYSINSSQSSLENRRKEYKNMAESYISRLLKYLQNNLDSYPLYKTFIGIDCDNSIDKTNLDWYLGPNL